MKTDEIREALALLHAAIGRADGAAIALQTRRLDELLEHHRADLHPQLAHFLERRSYAKALAWLEGESPAAGTCGPRAAKS